MVDKISSASSDIEPHPSNEYDQASKDEGFLATLEKYEEAGLSPKELRHAKDWYNHIHHRCTHWESGGDNKAKDAFIKYYDPFDAHAPLSPDQQLLEQRMGKGPIMAEERQTAPVYLAVRHHRRRYASTADQLKEQLNNNKPISTDELCNFAANTSVDDYLQAAHVMRDPLKPASGG